MYQEKGKAQIKKTTFIFDECDFQMDVFPSER